jgi:DNA-binding IclR family transcriptional regulator
MRRSKSEYVIQTVANAVRLLEAFSDTEELGVTELSRKLGLHKNNVFRLLATLEQYRLVEQCADRDRYRLGVGCLTLAQSLTRNRPLTRHGRAVLEDLAEKSGECAHLAALAGFDVVHLDGQASRRLLGPSLRIGDRLDAHCSALGKALLAAGLAGELERYDREVIRGQALPARTPETITDRDKFLDHIRQVAGHGFAVDLEECEHGLSCVAAPVLDPNGHAIAALSVSVPSFRVEREELHQRVLPHVVEAAAELSRRMGYSPH